MISYGTSLLTRAKDPAKLLEETHQGSGFFASVLS